jgi:hypothetical protein
LSPISIKVHLSDQARQAFSDLAAAVHFSDQFDPHILSVVEDFAKGTDFSVGDVICSLPSIAEEAFRHIYAHGDERAAAAWRAIGEALTEHGFTLINERIRPDHPRHL